MDETKESQEPEIEKEQKSSIKVTHNSKGYNWEVKVYDEDPDKILDKVIAIETKCVNTYGTPQEKERKR